MMPRPRKAPPEPGRLTKIGNAVGGAIAESLKHMGAELAWTAQHPVDRLLRGKGRTPGKAIIGPDGRTYYLSTAEVMAGPSGMIKGLLSTLSRATIQTRKAAATRMMDEMRLAKYGATFPISEKQLAAWNAGNIKGVRVVDDIDNSQYAMDDSLFLYRQPGLVTKDGKIVVGPIGTHHRELYPAAADDITSGAAAQFELWRPVKNHPLYDDIEPRLEIGGWAASPLSKRQKAAIIRAYQAAAREAALADRASRRAARAAKFGKK
jgi:hypothetical protein